jgi:hypothetical protein
MRSVLFAALTIAVFAGSATAQPQGKGRLVAASQTGSILPCDPLKLLPGCKSIAGPVTANLGTIWQKIVALDGPDLAYALSMANAAKTPGGNLRATCLQAIIAINQQTTGANLGPMPSPNFITQTEIAAEIIDSLQPTAPLVSNCAAAANAVAMNVIDFLNLLLAGVAVVPK